MTDMFRYGGRKSGGGDRIRTCDALTDILVFKTSAFNRSATPPPLRIYSTA